MTSPRSMRTLKWLNTALGPSVRSRQAAKVRRAGQKAGKPKIMANMRPKRRKRMA